MMGNRTEGTSKKKKHKKMCGIYQYLDPKYHLNDKNILYIVVRLGISPICTLGEGGFNSHARVLLSLVSQYHKCSCENLPKPDDNDKHMKMIEIPYLDIWSMLLSGQVLHKTNSSQLFWKEWAVPEKTNKQGEG